MPVMKFVSFFLSVLQLFRHSSVPAISLPPCSRMPPLSVVVVVAIFK